MDIPPATTSTKGPAELFTGDVYFDVLAKGEEPSQLRMNIVRFAPCSRTAWHTHAGGKTVYTPLASGTGMALPRITS